MWWENDDISIYRYLTGTGKKFNLRMRMRCNDRLRKTSASFQKKGCFEKDLEYELGEPDDEVEEFEGDFDFSWTLK